MGDSSNHRIERLKTRWGWLRWVLVVWAVLAMGAWLFPTYILFGHAAATHYDVYPMGFPFAYWQQIQYPDGVFRARVDWALAAWHLLFWGLPLMGLYALHRRTIPKQDEP